MYLFRLLSVRRNYVFLVLISILLFSCEPKSGDTKEKSKKQPNIIFLLTDDQRADALSIAGNTVLETPHLDQLARDGVWFKNAYVTTSICCVSRASILSGQYMSRHGIDNFSTSFEDSAYSLTYPMLLKEAGYNIGFIGKYGIGSPKDQPAEDYDFWACSTTGQPDYEMEDSNGNYLHHTDKVGNDIRDFLSNFGKQDDPFCLSVSFKAPHVQDNDPRQFIIQPRYADKYAEDIIQMPEKADPKYWNGFPDFFRTDENIARERWKLRFDGDEMYQNSVKNYYRLITGVDEVVGNLMAQLDNLGINDNTIIIFMGDNGFYLGEYGLAGKWYGHEESIRVPLILYDPRLPAQQKGLQNEDIVLNIDVAPTILSAAGIDIPEKVQGADLYQLLSGEMAKRKEFFYEHTFLGSPKIPKVEGVVGKDVKYMLFTEHHYEQLFDLKSDPGETENLAGESKYMDLLQKMRDSYDEWKLRVK